MYKVSELVFSENKETDVHRCLRETTFFAVYGEEFS